jgi:hypothetical protein
MASVLTSDLHELTFEVRDVRRVVDEPPRRPMGRAHRGRTLVGYVWRITASPGRYLAVLVTAVGDRVVGRQRDAEKARAVIEERLA